MHQEILIPAQYKFKFVEPGANFYCIDPQKPYVLAVTSEIKNAILNNQGLTVSAIKHRGGVREQILDQLVELKQKGFFSESEPANGSMPSVIKKISLAVTDICNLRCSYCYNEALSKQFSGSMMTEEMAQKALALFGNLDSDGIIEIDFFGGEPLLNFGLIKYIVEYTLKKELRARFTLSTNATIVTPEIAAFLAEHHFTVAVSLDGTADTHDANRCFSDGKGSFRTVIRGITVLQEKIGDKLSIHGVITRQFPYPDKIYAAYADMGLHNVSMKPVSAPENDRFDVSTTAMQSVMAGEKAIFERTREDHLTKMPRYLPFVQFMKTFATGKRKEYHCGAGRGSVAVSARGDIYPCHRFIGDKRFVIGTVSQGLYKEPQERYRPVYVRNNESCSDCWARFICGGPCLYDAYYYTDSLYGINADKCSRILNLIESSAILYGEYFKRDKAALRGYIEGECIMSAKKEI